MPQLIIYCDESTKKGKFYSDFYGGAILDARYKNITEFRDIAEKISQKLKINLYKHTILGRPQNRFGRLESCCL